MCKVANKYVVIEDGFIPGYNDIQSAHAVAAQNHERTGKTMVIYLAVEVTALAPAPITFKPVDGVNEN